MKADTYTPAGQIKTIKARQMNTGNDQVTTYTYGVTTGGGSGLNLNDDLAKVTYPDSTDNVMYKYNRQGQPIEMKDQAGSVHTYEYDKLSR